MNSTQQEAKTWYIRGEGFPTYFYFEIGDTAKIRRGRHNDHKGNVVTLKDRRVSRNHATIKFHTDFAELTDLGSSNGTFCCQPHAEARASSNDFCEAFGERVGNTPVKLQDGALFCVGDRVYQISSCPYEINKVFGCNPETLMSETRRISSYWLN